MTAPRPVPSHALETARDLQDRLARFARAVLVIVVVMGAASLGTHLATEGHAAESGSAAHELVHVATLAPALLTWLRCRGRQMTVTTLAALDAALTITLCVLYALLGLSAPSSFSVAFSVALAMSYTLVGRSILVPSSFHRTLWVSVAGAAPAIAYFATQGVPTRFGESAQSARIFVVFSTLWCVFAVLTAATNSRQLYGLRARIRETSKLGQYTLAEKIGEGGMGVVFRATHALLRRPAAIKLLSKERSSEQDQERFEREVQLTSRLAHPNTVSIFDYGRTADGVFYYVMEYLDGLDLDRLIQENGPLEPARTIHILAQVCGALAEAHALGLVHRDIKPANIVLTARVDEPDVVKVVDFGLARTLDKSDGDSLTAITGTPLYLSPESIANPETVDGRADLYALGAVGYFLLTGRNVFEGHTVVEVLSRHMLEEPKAPSTYLDEPLPSDLEALLLACLAKRRDARPPSAAALMAALLACEDAPRYDKQAAFEWWRARETKQPGPTLQAAPASPATMTVDLHRRGDSPEDSEPLVTGR